jgi:hypothetical protein
VRHPVRDTLAVLGTDLGADLGIHQRLSQHPHPFTQEVDIGAVGLAQQLQQLHLGHGHHVAPLDVLIEPFTSRTYAVATLISEPDGCSYTNPWDANDLGEGDTRRSDSLFQTHTGEPGRTTAPIRTMNGPKRKEPPKIRTRGRGTQSLSRRSSIC